MNMDALALSDEAVAVRDSSLSYSSSSVRLNSLEDLADRV